jgi:phage gpG-like protein
VTTFTLQYQLGDVTRVLHMMEARFEDASDLTADWLLLMIRSTQLNIEEQGRPQPFAPHADSTIRRRFGKAMKGKGAKAGGTLAALGSIMILRDTGLLMQSLGAGSSGAFESADGFGESDEFTATLGTNRPGADALQTGYEPNNLPGREYVMFQEQDETDLLRMTEDWTMGTGAYAEA